MLNIEIRGQHRHQLQIEATYSVQKLKEIVSQLENVPAADILLYNAGALLSDDMSASCLLTPVVELNIPLLGGKVHGSLARAGKVKGQTPKVEKQEKKKKKTGRAKRRIQYNRRFVNVVPMYGRRRGPNANS